jgi:hypothetical protein
MKPWSLQSAIVVASRSRPRENKKAAGQNAPLRFPGADFLIGSFVWRRLPLDAELRGLFGPHRRHCRSRARLLMAVKLQRIQWVR